MTISTAASGPGRARGPSCDGHGPVTSQCQKLECQTVAVARAARRPPAASESRRAAAAAAAVTDESAAAAADGAASG